MNLDSMEAADSGDPDVGISTRDALDDPELTYLVWGADWCGDCREQLPAFAAALDAANVPDERIEEFPVDEDKDGEGVDEYGIEYIPTVVVERDGEEVARYVEREPEGIAASLAERLLERSET